MNESPPASPAPSHAKVIVACIIVIAIGVVVFFNWWMKVQNDKRRMADRPAHVGELRHNIEATDVSGKTVNIGQLEGKVWVCAMVDPQLPAQDNQMVNEMKKLQNEFGLDPRFHLVAVSMDLTNQPPGDLQTWAASAGISGENWWFLTGSKDDLGKYIKEQVKLNPKEIAPESRKQKDDRWEHLFVLVDQERKVRGEPVYNLSDPGMNDVYKERLSRNIRALLDEGGKRVAYKGKLNASLEATEMSGKRVNLDELKGKVWVCGFLYTQCPRGCLGLAERMDELQKEFGSNPDFMLVSVSLDAEVDKPETLREWTKGAGFQTQNWWFLTGSGPLEGEKLRNYMFDEFKIYFREIPEKERLSSNDRWEHKLALVLVDRDRRIRGTYDFSDPSSIKQYEENLREDIKAVLAEKN